MMILEEVETEFGNIKILCSKSDGTCTYFQDKCSHSQINAEGVSTCAYVHVMYSIIRQAKAQNVLMIGCAGGSLATMLHRLGCTVTVLDINSYAFTLARRYFQMPEAVECVAEDGWSYLLRTEKHYDAIALDVFSSKGKIPREFTNGKFFQVVRNVLSPDGLVVMNVLTAHDLDMQAERIARNMKLAGLPAAIYDWPGKRDRNTIVSGGMPDHVRIPSGGEPGWILPELRGITCRKTMKNPLAKAAKS
jgi:spermidine synthase